MIYVIFQCHIHHSFGEMDDSTAAAIGSVVSLHFLSLRECELTFLPEPLLSGLTQLLRLDISGNYLTSVDS